MIQIRNKAAVSIPVILVEKGRIAAAQLMADFDNGMTEFSFDKSIYNCKSVKDELIQIQGYKCCFCEAKIGHIDDGDVEHFRPKAGWVQKDEPINKPGYYWLAYEWSNLFLSCTKCNQRHKKNYFPLIIAENRAGNHHESWNINNENPYFINPADEDPELYIEFYEEIAKAKGDNERGSFTIKMLGLDRELLNEDRRARFNTMRDIYTLAKNYPPSTPELQRRAKEIVLKYYNEAQDDRTEYASMHRCFFRDNPIDF